MIPARIGPYRVEALLGKGGCGVVYRATHAQNGHDAAVKRVELNDSAAVASLRREIRILGRIAHPAIVPILEHGTDGGLPWYAMALLAGRPLGQHCDAVAKRPRTARIGSGRWWTRWLAAEVAGEEVGSAASEPDSGTAPGESGRPLPPAVLQRLLTLILRLCSPLSYLHGEGIVHRDLKPQNVIVCEGDRPVIVDFGLIARFGGEAPNLAGWTREEIDDLETAVGTPAYMAPEQIRGELVDARADLYALGCILYEVITGRLPFIARSAYDLLDLHLHAPPIPPSRLTAGIPESLDALVLRLLAKDPRHRLGYADYVARALIENGAIAPSPDAETPGPAARTYLYRPGYVDRHGTSDTLLRRVRSLRNGPGGLVLVTGESGIGKTRLALEVVRNARSGSDEALVFASSCAPPAPGTDRRHSQAVGAPLESLRPVLRAIGDCCRSCGETETRRILGAGAAVLAALEPDLQLLPGQRQRPKPAELPPPAARTRIKSAMASVFANLAAIAPVLLVLDDLQWADPLTVELLTHLVRHRWLEKSAILVLGTLRREEATPALAALLAAPAVDEIQVQSMDAPAVAFMIRDILALEKAPEQFAGMLVRHTEGNPFFVGEYLRLAAEEALLTRTAGGTWHLSLAEPNDTAGEAVLPLPRSLRTVLLRRLQGLSAGGRALAEIAAVAGRAFSAALLERLAEVEGAPVEATGELLARGILQEAPALLSFGHDKIREVIYDEIRVRRRARLHRRVAAELAAGGSAIGERDPAQVGYHWERGKRREEAQACYLEAARKAKGEYALESADELFRACLRLTRGRGERAAIEAELALDVLCIQARYREALALQMRALATARRIGDARLVGASLAGIASCLLDLGKPEEALAKAAEALAVERRRGATDMEARVLRRIGAIAWSRGDLAGAERAFRQALDHFLRLGDRPFVCGTGNNLAVVLQQQGRGEESLAVNRKSLALARELGDRRLEATLLLNEAGALWELGDLTAALAAGEQALALLREVGDRHSEGIVHSHLGGIHLEIGQMDQAIRELEAAARIFAEIESRRSAGVSVGAAAFVAARQGELQRAESLCLEAIGAHREVADRVSESITLANLDTIRLQMGKAEGSCELADEALAIARATGSARALILALRARARRAAAAGEAGTESAVALLEEAIGVARASAAEVSLAQCQCELGLLFLARGRTAEALLREAAEVAERRGVLESSELGEAVAALAAAQRRFAAGGAGEAGGDQ
ncbi:MAG: tetratricopeptide repeat protein [Candidatus Schekmanbacteria bacterium]|nr:tetratricopeptide repeat protein [Candidatus Schekmanbacteria bacterium]